jgi:hypothetical protein
VIPEGHGSAATMAQLFVKFLSRMGSSRIAAGLIRNVRRNPLTDRFLWAAFDVQGSTPMTWSRPQCMVPGPDLIKLLIKNELFGWEAGIRTPITWFRGGSPDGDGDGLPRFY